MPGGVEVLSSVLVWRIVATAYVAAGKALAKVHPGVSRLQALLTTLAARFDVPDMVRVRAAPGEAIEHDSSLG